MTFAEIDTEIRRIWPDLVYEPFAGSGHLYTLPCGTPIMGWQGTCGARGARVCVNFAEYRGTLPDAINAARREAYDLRDNDAVTLLDGVWREWVAAQDPR